MDSVDLPSPTTKHLSHKRATVVRIEKPKDEKKEVFKKMLLLGEETENCLSRTPVFAWENEYRDIEEDKQVNIVINYTIQARILCITWNMNNDVDDAPSNIHEIVKRDIQHDIYVISVQNCKSFTKWEKAIMNVLGDAYEIIAHHEYRQLGISLICRKKAKDVLNIRDFQTDHYRDANKVTKTCALGV